MNNLMIRTNGARNGEVNGQSETSIENVILIDFQYSCWTSPAIDLHYFLNTSLQESLRPGRFDELIGIYHANLVEYLKQLDYKNHIPNFDQFKKQYQDKKFYGMNYLQTKLNKNWSHSNDSCFVFTCIFLHLGFVVACLVQPLMINEHVEDANIEALLLNDERAMKFKRIMYSSAKVQANVQKLVPMYDEMGLFD